MEHFGGSESTESAVVVNDFNEPHDINLDSKSVKCGLRTCHTIT